MPHFKSNDVKLRHKLVTVRWFNLYLSVQRNMVAVLVGRLVAPAIPIVRSLMLRMVNEKQEMYLSRLPVERLLCKRCCLWNSNFTVWQIHPTNILNHTAFNIVSWWLRRFAQGLNCTSIIIIITGWYVALHRLVVFFLNYDIYIFSISQPALAMLYLHNYWGQKSYFELARQNKNERGASFIREYFNYAACVLPAACWCSVFYNRGTLPLFLNNLQRSSTLLCKKRRATPYKPDICFSITVWVVLSLIVAKLRILHLHSAHARQVWIM